MLHDTNLFLSFDCSKPFCLPPSFALDLIISSWISCICICFGEGTFVKLLNGCIALKILHVHNGDVFQIIIYVILQQGLIE